MGDGSYDYTVNVEWLESCYDYIPCASMYHPLLITTACMLQSLAPYVEQFIGRGT